MPGPTRPLIDDKPAFGGICKGTFAPRFTAIINAVSACAARFFRTRRAGAALPPEPHKEPASMRSQAHSVPWLTLLFALLGLAWCGYMAFPTASPPPCATSGCALFRDTKFAGLSLWGVGGGYFFVLAVLCLRGRQVLARQLSLLALFLDALLLLVMFLTAPCFDCLVVAALIGLGYYSLIGSGEGWFQEASKTSILLPVWFGLFLGNAVLAGNEMLPAHSINGKNKADLRIYFSPTCPACREALTAFGDKAVLYPVLEGEGDMAPLLRLEAFLAAKMPMAEAVERSLDPAEPVPDLSFYRRALLELQLVRNKAALMRQGFRALPLIQVNGMPGHASTSLERASLPGRPGAQATGEPQGANAQPGAHSAPNGQGAPEAPTDGFSPWPEQPGRPPAVPPAPLHDNGGLPEFLQGADTLRSCGGENTEPCP